MVLQWKEQQILNHSFWFNRLTEIYPHMKIWMSTYIEKKCVIKIHLPHSLAGFDADGIWPLISQCDLDQKFSGVLQLQVQIYQVGTGSKKW